MKAAELQLVAATGCGWCTVVTGRSVNLLSHNLLNHAADLNLNFTLFRLADSHVIGARDFFLNLASDFDSASALFRLADSHVIGVRNFFLNLTSNFDSASALFRLADSHVVGVRNFFLNLTSNLDGASVLFLLISRNVVGVRLVNNLLLVAGVLNFVLHDVGDPDFVSCADRGTSVTG